MEGKFRFTEEGGLVWRAHTWPWDFSLQLSEVKLDILRRRAGFDFSCDLKAVGQGIAALCCSVSLQAGKLTARSHSCVFPWMPW